MASDGWAGVGWPKEWGGKGLTPIEQFVFFDESMRAGAPVPMLTINSVAPTIMRYGSEEQKQFYVPKILAGEIHFAIGYTEPDAGTDLASLKTRAVRDGDEYVINGQKIFTSLASGVDYIWLAVRTNTRSEEAQGHLDHHRADRHARASPYVPIENFGGVNTNITYYEDVRVPAGNLVGEENQGWNLITNQLNHERVTLCSSGVVERHARRRARLGAEHEAGRRSPRDRPGVGAGQPRPRARQARVPAARELEGRVARAERRAVEPGRRVDRSRCSAPSSTWRRRGCSWKSCATRRRSRVTRPVRCCAGRVERMLRSMHILTFGGGTNEMQRDLIAIFGLNMPGSPR